MKSNLLSIIVFIILGCPGSLFCLGGVFALFVAFTSDAWQLRMDTGLEQAEVARWGWIGLLAGMVLVAIPIAIRIFAARK